MRRPPELTFAAFALALVACAPQLSGAPCALTGPNANDCPTGQACVAVSDGGAVCVEGASSADAGVPDGGDAGTVKPDGGSDAGPDAGPDSGVDAGQSGFAGTVVLNGGATPVNSTWIYGFEGSPLFGDGGAVLNDVFFATAGSGGAWSVSGDVTTSPYYFAAQYDISGHGNSMQINPGDFFGVSPITGITQPNQMSVPINVETSTCFSVTAELQSPNLTVLFGVGAQAYDITTNTAYTALTTAVATFDAGAATFPDAGAPPPPLSLSLAGSVPGDPFSNDWVYGVPQGSIQLLSNEGAFEFTLSDSDASGRTPEFPHGTCRVGYSDAPGFPSNINVSLGSALASSYTLTWNDPVIAPAPNIAFEEDVVTVTAPDGTVLYTTPSDQTSTSPTQIPKSAFTTAGCGALSGKMCTAEVTSLFSVIQDARSTAFEGGAVLYSFQAQ